MVCIWHALSTAAIAVAGFTSVAAAVSIQVGRSAIRPMEDCPVDKSDIGTVAGDAPQAQLDTHSPSHDKTIALPQYVDLEQSPPSRSLSLFHRVFGLQINVPLDQVLIDTAARNPRFFQTIAAPGNPFSNMTANPDSGSLILEAWVIDLPTTTPSALLAHKSHTKSEVLIIHMSAQKLGGYNSMTLLSLETSWAEVCTAKLLYKTRN
ncbi:MAG: hypothetical protein Q9218_003685 [Villophora microphyllina]